MIGNMDYATTYTFMYLEINLMAIILVAIILYKTQGISKMVAQRNFAMSIYSAIVFFASDTVFVLTYRMQNIGLSSYFHHRMGKGRILIQIFFKHKKPEFRQSHESIM